MAGACHPITGFSLILGRCWQQELVGLASFPEPSSHTCRIFTIKDKVVGILMADRAIDIRGGMHVLDLNERDSLWTQRIVVNQ